MLESISLPALSNLKFWDTSRAPTNAPTKGHTEEYQPLAATEEAVPLEEINDMGRSFEEQFEKPEGKDGDAIAQVIAISSIAVVVITTWLITFISGTSFFWFAWHPLLISVGVALISYGILTLQPTSQPKTKAAGLVRHQLAMIWLGIPMSLLGFLAVFFNKLINGRAHFTSWHGLFGLVTVIIWVTQVVLGGGSVWFNGKLFGGNPKAKYVWKYHRLVGYVTFCLMLLTLHLGGAWSHFSTEHSASIVRVLAYTLAPVALLGGVYSRIRLSKMQFF